MIEVWETVPLTTSGNVLGSFFDLPEEVQQRARALPKSTSFVFFATDSLLGFCTQGRGSSVARISAPVVVETLRSARGPGSHTIMVGPARLIRWSPRDHALDEVVQVAQRIADLLGVPVATRDLGLDC